MTKRLRMIAGPNGSGKSTLMRRLSEDYAVNFYDFLNADDIFAEVSRSLAYQPMFSVDGDALADYAARSTYPEAVKNCFTGGVITVEDDCVRFRDSSAVNSYTIALLTNFLQHESIRCGRCFSQETVFSHPSKIAALAAAKAAGYRTYLYYIATSSPRINSSRVANRARQGGHDVPPEKIAERYRRSLALVPQALPQLSRAYFFDNSGSEMTYLAQWNPTDGLIRSSATDFKPKWMESIYEKLS